MKWLLEYFRLMFKKHRVSMSLLTLQTQLAYIQTEKKRSDKELAERERVWLRLSKWYEEEIKESKEALVRASEVNKKLEVALAASLEHIKTLEEIQIPGLVEANQVFVQRWQAESAVHVMRQVALKKTEPMIE